MVTRENNASAVSHFAVFILLGKIKEFDTYFPLCILLFSDFEESKNNLDLHFPNATLSG